MLTGKCLLSSKMLLCAADGDHYRKSQLVKMKRSTSGRMPTPVNTYTEHNPHTDSPGNMAEGGAEGLPELEDQGICCKVVSS